jgi:hypothetical protein
MHNVYSLHTFIASSYMFGVTFTIIRENLRGFYLKPCCYVGINCGFCSNYIVNYV